VFFLNMVMNEDLRIRIVEHAYAKKEGHIPSCFSIIDILSVLYGKFLKYNPKNPDWKERDYFILSKGHGSGALYAILEKYGFIDPEIKAKNLEKKIFGGHPDCTKIPGVEASTGSLGHGIGIAAGIALGLKIKERKNRVIALIGDGESNEGTVWETALVASSQKLGNLCVIVDNNQSTKNVLPVPNMLEKWGSFGWNTYSVNGHSEEEIYGVLKKINFDYNSNPSLIVAGTIKGKGVGFMENQGSWHHRIPTEEELKKILKELKND